MKRTCSILLLCAVTLQVATLLGSQKDPEQKVRLTADNTRKWLEGYFKEIKDVGSDAPRAYTTEKLKEWCDRCTPENAFQSLSLNTKVDPDGNTALHLFCQQADVEMLRHVFAKIFPKDYKKGIKFEFKVGKGPDDIKNKRKRTPFDLIPVCNWEMYDFLKEYGYAMDETWSFELGKKLVNGIAEHDMPEGRKIFDKRKAEEYDTKKVAPPQIVQDNHLKNRDEQRRFYKAIGVKAVAAFFIGVIGYEVYRHYQDKKAIDKSFNDLMVQDNVLKFDSSLL